MTTGYGKSGFTGFAIPQTKGGSFGQVPTMPQAPATQPQQIFQPTAPQPAATQAPSTSILGQGQSRPAAAPAPVAQPTFSNNVMAQNLPQTTAIPAGNPTATNIAAVAQQAPTATTAAQKPKVDPTQLIMGLFNTAQRSANPIALKGGGMMNTLAGGYDANTMLDAAMQDPEGFLAQGKQYYDMRSANSDPINDKVLFNEFTRGMNGNDVVFRGAPDFLKELVTGYNKAPVEEAPAPAPAATPEPAAQDPLDAEQNDMDAYYNQLASNYDGVISGYQNQLNSLNDFITRLTSQNDQSISDAIEPQPIAVSRPYEMAKPTDLGDFLTGLSDLQARTALATRGAQGEGLGKEGEDYFLNMLLRNLIGDGGSMGQLEDLTPIETQYLGQLGLPTADEQAFLKALKTRGNYLAA